MNSLIKIDKGMDYVPLLSTTNNLVSLFIKGIYPILSPHAKNNRYIAHLNKKDAKQCALLLIPVVGNIVIYQRRKAYKDLIRQIKEAALAHATNLRLDDITVLPRLVGRLTNLTILNLAGNQLRNLPTEIGLLTKLTSLDLSKNQLASLPTEIGKLINLKCLNLKNNHLTALPTECGNFSKLQPELDLSYNRLASLPTEIGKLSVFFLFLAHNRLRTLPGEIGGMPNLYSLTLENNQIDTLPGEIGRLTELNDIQIDHNELSSLPVEFGKLTNLKYLWLSHNRFTSFPSALTLLTKLSTLMLDDNLIPSLPHIGQLSALTFLDIHNNPLTALPAEIRQLIHLKSLFVQGCKKLRTLPMTLGEIPALEDLITHHTPIPQEVIAIILYQCRQLRDQQARIDLPTRLMKWILYADQKGSLDSRTLNEQEAFTLNEWLLRLEKTKDFANAQSTLAKLVCTILADLHHPEFRSLFFNQADANNICCQDRSAMSLNEIYTSWLLLCKAPHLPQREKLQKMAGVARTLCLRRKLQKMMQKLEERESVEIFLYYEIALRNTLKLETAIQTMAYETIGKRYWIDKAALIKEVQCDFYEDLIDMPLFNQMMQWNTINEEFQQKLEELGDSPDGESESTPILEYQVRQGEIMAAWKKRKMEAAKGYLCQFQIV